MAGDKSHDPCKRPWSHFYSARIATENGEVQINYRAMVSTGFIGFILTWMRSLLLSNAGYITELRMK